MLLATSWVGPNTRERRRSELRIRISQRSKRIAIAAVGVLTVLSAWVITSSETPDPPGGDDAASDISLLLAPSEAYNPVAAGEELPAGFRQVVPRDAIRPVYRPTFVDADEVDWPATSLVIGLELDGEARAYPVEFLNRREMVVDSLAGIPVLVTW